MLWHGVVDATMIELFLKKRLKVGNVWSVQVRPRCNLVPG